MHKLNRIDLEYKEVNGSDVTMRVLRAVRRKAEGAWTFDTVDTNDLNDRVKADAEDVAREMERTGRERTNVFATKKIQASQSARLKIWRCYDRRTAVIM